VTTKSLLVVPLLFFSDSLFSHLYDSKLHFFQLRGLSALYLTRQLALGSSAVKRGAAYTYLRQWLPLRSTAASG